VDDHLGSAPFNARSLHYQQPDESRQPRVDFYAINRAAMAALPAVLSRLLPRGKRDKHEYVALNPRRADRHAGSFRINMRTGKWADFATKDGGGDIVSLTAYLEGVSQSNAARLLATMLGVRL
jgi:hypothetical protein